MQPFSYLVNQFVAAVCHKALQEVVFRAFYVHLEHDKVIFLHINVAQELAQTSGWRAGGRAVVQSHVVVVQLHGIRDPCRRVPPLCGRGTFDTLGDGRFQGPHVGQVGRALKTVQGIKLDRIILHYPAETAVEILDAEIDVDPTLVHRRV